MNDPHPTGSPEQTVAQAKPRLRGVLHKYAFFVSLIGGAALIAGSPSPKARLAAAIYALALSGLFASSTLYHRIQWSAGARRWMRRIDHSMIFVLIAGTYTPFALLVASGARSLVVLLTVWAAALAGVLLKVLWAGGPRWVTVTATMAVGWLVVATTPSLAFQAGAAAAVLLLTGGLLYTSGALVYAFRRPDPIPEVFGYHEVFHTLVIAAAAAHFATIAIYILPRG